MQFVEQIQEFISSVPKPVIFAVVLLVLIGGFFLWKKMSSKDRKRCPSFQRVCPERGK